MNRKGEVYKIKGGYSMKTAASFTKAES